MTLPVSGGSSRGDGYTSFLLLLHPVHGSGTVMGFAHFVVDTGVEKNTLSGGGLSCVDMGHDTDISRH
jgi:hypothetical protein